MDVWGLLNYSAEISLNVSDAKVKRQQKSESDMEDSKEREDSGELSDYPLLRNKRQRKCKREEEGDWMPPKKVGRGPGKSQVTCLVAA